MTPKICVSILPKTEAEALSLIDKAEKAQADFVEVRLDALRGVQNLTDIARWGRTPKIATNKNHSFGEQEHNKLLLNAAKNGFDYVDIDLDATAVAFINEVKGQGAKCIVSYHDFQVSLTPQELNAVFEREVAAGADVCKIVTTPKYQQDNLTLLQFIQAASNKAKVVCFGMGDCGKISRLLSATFGGFFTFASLEKNSETASGQLSIEEMKAAYKLLGL